MTSPLLVTLDDRGTARVTLNRPEKHNAFDAALIAELTGAFTAISADPKVRAVVLRGNGPSFCAGADAGWMRSSADLSEVENRADALRLSAMLAAINDCPKPVIAVAHGFVFGGGVGLIACADLVIARSNTRFRLSEVRLGLTPATISPFVVAKIGRQPRAALFHRPPKISAPNRPCISASHISTPTMPTSRRCTGSPPSTRARRVRLPMPRRWFATSPTGRLPTNCAP
jgi:methylglutaconyl-CoA hydratase